MTARKLKNDSKPQRNFAEFIASKVGSVVEPIELWLPQVEKYDAKNHVIPEMVLHIFSNLALAKQARHRPYYRIVKRIFDIALVITFAVPILLLFVVIAIAIKYDSPGPFFFRQTRIGKMGLPFAILKFRTMYVNSETMLELIQSRTKYGYFKGHDDPRITKVGKFLRRWSLDETPQLINILLGDMTLIGPRPLPIYDVVTIPYNQMNRFSVKPGLTGLWQVTARNSTDAKRNLEIDQQYVNSYNWRMDLLILVKTPIVVISGIGAR